MPEDIFRWHFAISYAGEEAGLASDLHRLLQERGFNVFFALSEKVYLWGKRQGDEFRNIFGTNTLFAVILLSNYYVNKFWPLYEYNVVRKEQHNRDYEYILPILVDKVKLDGLDEDVGYIDLRKEGILNTVQMMIKKLSDVQEHRKLRVPTEWLATFGANMEDLMENDQLPETVSRFYPELCDWLQQNLMERLAQVGLRELRYLEDLRTGETFSLRVSFEWDPHKVPLDFGDTAWWEVLEVEPFQ